MYYSEDGICPLQRPSGLCCHALVTFHKFGFKPDMWLGPTHLPQLAQLINQLQARLRGGPVY